MFVLGFAVMLVANGIMITFAVRTWTGLGTEAPYEKGIRYNESLAAARAQDKLGWRHDIELQAMAPSTGRLVFVLSDADAQPIFADRVDVKLVRPTHEGWDFETELVSRGGGRYSADVAFPLAGQWEARFFAQRGAESYQVRQRVLID